MFRKIPKPIRRLLLYVFIWDMFWKGTAVWKAARDNELPWFIALLVSNTAGALPIYYLFLRSTEDEDDSLTAVK